MVQSTWTIRISAVVQADLTSVVEWWTHPDRLADSRTLYERRGATDLSVQTSERNGRRLREWTVRYPTGEVFYEVETELGPDGPGFAEEGRHVIRAWDHQRVDYATGRRVTMECENITELVADLDGTTTINSVHRHHKCGGQWFERFLPPNSERALLKRELQAMAAQCEMDLARPSGNSPN